MLEAYGVTQGDIIPTSEQLGKYDLHCPDMGLPGLNYWSTLCNKQRRPAGCLCPQERKALKAIADAAKREQASPDVKYCACGNKSMADHYLKKNGYTEPFCSMCNKNKKDRERHAKNARNLERKKKAALMKKKQRIEHELAKMNNA